MEKKYCKKCGRPLDKGDIDYCKGCFEEENGKSYNEYQRNLQNEKENSYTNIVANDLKTWSRNFNIIGIIISLIIVISIFIINDSTYTITLFVSSFIVYCLFKIISLILLAVAEIVQKLQNIEDSI